MRGIVATVLWGVAVLVLIGVAMPYGMGWLWASRFDGMTARLAVPGYVRVVSSRFKRGWFESNARIVLQPAHRFCSTLPCPTLTVNSRIVHGPLVWSGHQQMWHLALGVVYSEVDWASLLPRYTVSGNHPRLHATSRVALDKATLTRLRLDEGRFELALDRQPQAQVQTSAVRGTVPTSAHPYKLDGAVLDWPRLSLAFEKSGKIAWQDAHLAYRPSEGKAGYGVSARELTLDDGQGNATRLTGLQFHIPQATDDHWVVLSLHVDKLVLPNNMQAGLDLRASARGLNIYPWLMLPERWAELGGLSGGALASSVLYRSVIPRLLPPDASLNIGHIELNTPEGTISGHFKVAAPKGYMPSLTGLILLSQIRLQADISLPNAVVQGLAARLGGGGKKEGMQQRIKSWVKRGLIEPTADHRQYRIRLTLKNGQLTINGKARPGWQREFDRMQKQSQPASPVETLD